MRHRVWYTKNRWRLLKGIAETAYDFYDELKDTQWSHKFESLMRHRLIMGALRYGNIIGLNKPKQAKYDYVHSIERRTELYKQTGNAEYLVDIANFALLEFVNETHKDFHFTQVDDGEHAKLL